MLGKRINLLLVTAVIAGLAFSTSGCAKKKTAAEEMAPVRAEEPADRGRMDRGDEESLASKHQGRFTKSLEGRTSAPMLPVYFDYDQFNIKKEQVDRMVGNANFLKQNPTLKVRVEGNCDERGTNEYNMALGERRAQSAKKYLVNLGVSADRLETVSYGEESPLVSGHDEAAWTQNRRGDFVVVE